MKALTNEMADVGVGTLIVFIAMVLVAAVAAIVLIYSTGELHQKAIITSKDATATIATNFQIENVVGDRVNSTMPGLQPGIQSLLIRIKPEVGTESMDLRQIMIILNEHQFLNYSNNSDRVNAFGASIIRDIDGSFTANYPVLNSGDLVDINVHALNYTNPILVPRQTISLYINQERGASIHLEITAPYSFGIDRYVKLYP
ncbi:Flagellin B2 [uncultured archaeon]|nr:Flagellin B2 [uncultured archaeon]